MTGVQTCALPISQRGVDVAVFLIGQVADVRGDLSGLVRGTVSGRSSAEEITLFKSVGYAIEDLAAAELALRVPPA